MNKFVRLTAIAGLLWAGVSYGAETANIRIGQLPQLQQEPQHATVSERVTSRFTRSHYRQFALDAEFSGKIFDRYLNMLDYNHNVLLASDVAQFAGKRNGWRRAENRQAGHLLRAVQSGAETPFRAIHLCVVAAGKADELHRQRHYRSRPQQSAVAERQGRAG